MHGQLAVRIRDRAGHLREQAQPRFHVEVLLAAVHVDVLAFDVLDGEIGLPARSDACIVQMGNVWMGQRRENLALARHALREPGALPRAVRKLQRHWPFDEAVSALGQPDHPHAAAAQLAQEPIRPDHVARLITIGRDLRDVQQVSVEFRKGVEVRGSLVIRGPREQRAQLGLDRGVLRPEQVDPSTTL